MGTKIAEIKSYMNVRLRFYNNRKNAGIVDDHEEGARCTLNELMEVIKDIEKS